MARSEPTAEVILVTPAMAQEWLATNTRNRRVRRAHVERLKGAIDRGEWTLNGSPIIFDTNGVLLDGQHRLTAFAEGTKSAQCLVVRGVRPEAQDTIDTGQVGRNLGDALEIRGYGNYTTLAAMITFKWRLDNDLVRTRRQPSTIQGLQILKDHPDIGESVAVASKVKQRVRAPSSVIGALHYEFAGVDEEAAETFFDLLTDPVGLTKRNAIYALRRYFETNKATPVMAAALTIKAWNSYMNGEEVSMLRWRPVGKRPEEFPEIWGYEE